MNSDYWLQDIERAPALESDLAWKPQINDGYRFLKARMSAGLAKSSTMPGIALENWESAIFRTAARCVNPLGREDSNSSQLVVGRVQAGKTASFTGLIRLLADNSYRIFIVVAGSSVNLRDQTFDRLSSELSDSDDVDVVRTGTNFDTKLEAQNLTKRMRRWASGSNSSQFLELNERKIVYVALKSTKAHLDSLVEMLDNVRMTAEGDRLLASTPALIIDDEADQASPNGKASSRDQREITAIYDRLSIIRDRLKVHSFVGYTATPYANVLMGIASKIRPEYVTMLDPGLDYTGAMDLFHSDVSFAKIISDFDDSEALPESLKLAFASFLIQTIIYHCQDSDIRSQYFLEPFLSKSRGGTTTMLVHADRLVKVTKTITQLLRELREYWASIFQSGKGDIRRKDHGEDHIWNCYFEPALVDLESGQPNTLPREIFRDAVREMLVEIEILEIVGAGDEFPSDNASDGKPLWKSRMGWVLVGGQLLDRGQTLPNLMTTYMPRSPGGGAKLGEIGGQFDTLQQRGRFYGHRRTYRRILRGWFSENTLETYREIALIEQQHFDFLSELDEKSIGLEGTQILLDKGNSQKLKLVRSSVLGKDVIELKASVWVSRQLWYSAHDSHYNGALLSKFVSNLSFQKYFEGDGYSTRLTNYRTTVPAATLSKLLEDWLFQEGDIVAFEVARHILANSIKNEGLEQAEIVLMSRDETSRTDISSHGQYRSSVFFKNGSGPGAEVRKIKQLPSSNDAKFTSGHMPTLQVHFLEVRDSEGAVRFKDSIGLALSIPSVNSGVYRGALNER